MTGPQQQYQKRNQQHQNREREHPIEPEANPKRRLLVKSAPLTASGSGQQRQKRTIPDGESRMQVEATPEARHWPRHGVACSTIGEYRRIAVKSEPIAVTTQEAVDGRRENAMRIECRTNRAGQHHGGVDHRSGAQVGKTIELIWRFVST